MAIYRKGYENISVKLINFAGNDLARQTIMFGNLGEFYEGIDEYSPDNKECQRIVDEIISGKTFPKYAFEGHNIAFQINNISRVCLAQLTREKGFFCSASGDVRPLTQDFIIPRRIYENKNYMEKLDKAQKILEDLYIEMCKDGVPYMESRYLGLHAQTISLCYNAPAINWIKSCNSRTENNFADEINYIYRLMLVELKKAIKKQVTDPLSLKLWNWLLEGADKKTWYKRDHTYNNDFDRYPTPVGYVFDEPAHNDWRKSSWKLELEDMFVNSNKYDLLLPGEPTMIQRWLIKEAHGEPLPSTYDPNFEKVAEQAIKKVNYVK